jgi:hypothetical protein
VIWKRFTNLLKLMLPEERGFNDLAETIYSLERFPERGAVVPESKKLRHLLLGESQAPTELCTPWISASAL